MPTSHKLGSSMHYSFHSSFLLVCMLGNSRWHIKYLGPRHPYGNLDWVSAPGFSLTQSPLLGAFGKQMGDLVLCLCLSATLCLSIFQIKWKYFQKNENYETTLLKLNKYSFSLIFVGTFTLENLTILCAFSSLWNVYKSFWTWNSSFVRFMMQGYLSQGPDSHLSVLWILRKIPFLSPNFLGKEEI